MEWVEYLRFLAALGLVLGLIAGCAWIARRIGMTPRVSAKAPKGARKRLGIVEVSAIDAKRRLVLIRRDQTEHLILLGVDSETVVERDIAAPRAAAEPARVSALAEA